MNDETRPPPTPRWIRVAGIVVVLVILVVVALLLVAGGQHGPSRHG